MFNKNFQGMAPLFLAIFIDSIGISLFVPLATPLFMGDHGIVSADTSSFLRNLLYGLSIGIYSLAGVIGAPLLGSVSDRVGRKLVLMVCLGSTCAGYLLCAVAVHWHSISLLLLGRVIDGFTGGSMTIAQAAIVDNAPQETKAVQIGYVLLAASLGFILGPLVASIFSNPALVSWFNVATPLYFAALMAAVNLGLLFGLFQETFKPHAEAHAQRSYWQSIAWFFESPTIRLLAVVFLCLQLGWATYFEFIGLFLHKTYQFDEHMIGYFMSGIGVGYTITFCYLLQKLIARFSLKKLALMAIGFLAIFVWGNLFFRYSLEPWITLIPATICLATGYSVLITLFSNAVDANHQGRIMGFSGAITSLSFGCTALISGFIANLSVSAPLIWAALCLSFGAGLLLKYHKVSAVD